MTEIEATELEAANAAILNLTAEWHRVEIALDKARRELAEWRRVNVIDTRRAVKRALSARAVARYARRMRRERDAALRGQLAPAQPLDDDGACKCGHARGQHRGVCMIFPCKCMEFTAPAQGQE